MKELEPIIHLLSGGLDSTVLLYDLHAQGHPLHCVLFDYGQRHAIRELEFARYHCDLLHVHRSELDLPALKGSRLTDGTGSNVVPNRNAILLSIAVAIAIKSGTRLVTFASNGDDSGEFPDCRRGFIDSFNAMVKETEANVRIAAPYVNESKAYILGRARDLSVPIQHTWSCYEGGQQPCGKCGACEKRIALGI